MWILHDALANIIYGGFDPISKRDISGFLWILNFRDSWKISRDQDSCDSRALANIIVGRFDPISKGISQDSQRDFKLGTPGE